MTEWTAAERAELRAAAEKHTQYTDAMIRDDEEAACAALEADDYIDAREAAGVYAEMMATGIPVALDRIDALEAENERLRASLYRVHATLDTSVEVTPEGRREADPAQLRAIVAHALRLADVALGGWKPKGLAPEVSGG